MRLGRHVFAQADTPFPCGNKGVHLTYLDFCLLKRSTNDFKKVYRAKTPRTQRKLFFLAPFAPLRETQFFRSLFQISLASFI